MTRSFGTTKQSPSAQHHSPGDGCRRLSCLAAARAGAGSSQRHDQTDELSAYGAGNKWRRNESAALLDDFDVDPETKRVLGVALEKTRVSLGLADDFADGIIAKRLIELAKAGECNPDLLCEGAIEKLRGYLFGD